MKLSKQEFTQELGRQLAEDMEWDSTNSLDGSVPSFQKETSIKYFDFPPFKEEKLSSEEELDFAVWRVPDSGRIKEELSEPFFDIPDQQENFILNEKCLEAPDSQGMEIDLGSFQPQENFADFDLETKFKNPLSHHLDLPFSKFTLNEVSKKIVEPDSPQSLSEIPLSLKDLGPMIHCIDHKKLSRSKSSRKQSDFLLSKDHIIDALRRNDHTILDEKVKGRRRGRPEKVINYDYKVIMKEIYHQSMKKLVKGLAKIKEKRPDAKLTSLTRALKKIPSLLLRYAGSKWKYKKKDPTLYVREWVKTFNNCIWKIYQIPDDRKVDFFLDYTVLSYPDAKVLEVVQLFFPKDSPHFKKYKLQLADLKRGTSKVKMGELYKKNRFFQLVVDSYIKFIPSEGEDLKDLKVLFTTASEVIFKIKNPKRPSHSKSS